MSKKDYALIATAINDTNKVAMTAGETQMLRVLAGVLALRFEDDNPKFNRVKFLAACGLEVPA